MKKVQKGYILTEILVSFLIMSLALIAISAMFIQALQMDMIAHHYTVTSNLAQKQLELLKMRPPAFWAGLSLPYNIPWQDDTQILPAIYNFTTNAIQQESNPHLIEVTVTATWQEKDKEYSVAFTTFYSTL